TFIASSDADGKLLIQGRRNSGATVNFNVFINAIKLKRRDLVIQKIELVSADTLRLTIPLRNPALTHRVEERENVNAGDWSEVQNVFVNGPNGDILEL